jgi:hypothetical protein
MKKRDMKESGPQKPKGDQSEHGGDPMAMMQKMMAQMGHGEGGSPMECMMTMCTEMMAATRQTTALAVFATPELHDAFGDWLKSVEVKAAEIIAKGETDSVSLAAALNIGEETANYILGRLARSGSVTLIGRRRNPEIP